MAAIVNILHLSDLHFEDSITEEKKELYSSIVRELEAVADSQPGWKPDYITISGDIAEKNKGYNTAKTWIGKFLRAVNLDVKSLILCPGNHDLDRKVLSAAIPKKKQPDPSECYQYSKNSLDPANPTKSPAPYKSKKNIGNTNIQKLNEGFAEYEKFCQSIKYQPTITLEGTPYYTFGHRIFDDVAFVVVNSAWFCRGDLDMGNLYLGETLVEYLYHTLEKELEEKNPRPDSKPPNIVVTLCHHPSAWLNWMENYTWFDRQASYSKLINNSEIILSGHEHGSLAQPSWLQNSAQLFVNGSVYQSADKSNFFLNNFSIIQIDFDKQILLTRQYKYGSKAPSSNQIKWLSEVSGQYPIFPENPNSNKQLSGTAEKIRFRAYIDQTKKNRDDFLKKASSDGSNYDKEVIRLFLLEHQKKSKVEENPYLESASKTLFYSLLITQRSDIVELSKSVADALKICKSDTNLFVLPYAEDHNEKLDLQEWNTYKSEVLTKLSELRNRTELNEWMRSGRMLIYPMKFLDRHDFSRFIEAV